MRKRQTVKRMYRKIIYKYYIELDRGARVGCIVEEKMTKIESNEKDMYEGLRR
jgi:hypothetical protein